MALVLYSIIVLCVSVSLNAVTQDNNTSSSGLNVMLSTNTPGDGAKPTQTPDSGLTTLAFGVMSFILILIVVMVILVTAVNIRGRANSTKEESVKNYSSVISEGQKRNPGERDSIILVSMRTLNADTDTDSPRISSIYSTAPDSEYQ